MNSPTVRNENGWVATARTNWKRNDAQSCSAFQISTGENTTTAISAASHGQGLNSQRRRQSGTSANASDRRQQHDRGEFRQQRQPCEQTRGQPPARIAALVQPHQRPQHRNRTGDHRRVGRDLRHQQPVIQRRFRQQHREDDGAHIMRHAPDDVGEQKLRDQHRDDAAEPHAETGVAEDRGAEPDQPGDAGRMIEKGKRALLRPGPVIGLVGAQIEHAGIDQPHRRQCGDQQRNGKPGHLKPRRGGTGLAFMGRGDRHGAFSSTAPGVSTCRDGKKVYRRPCERRDPYAAAGVKGRGKTASVQQATAVVGRASATTLPRQITRYGSLRSQGRRVDEYSPLELGT